MFHDLSLLSQGALYATLGFFLLSLVLLWFRRGIAMQLALLLSFIAVSVLCVDLEREFYIFCLLFFYLAFWVYQAQCYVFLLAKKQLDAEWSIVMSDFEMQPVDPNDYPDMDHEFYDSCTRILEENGFDKLQDVNFLHSSRAHPFIRKFTRVFLSRGYDISTGVTQLKAKVTIIPFFKTFFADYHIVEFSTGFTDGTFLSTINALGICEMEIEGITFDYRPPDTPIEELLARHRESIARICEERGVDVQLHRTEADLFAVGVRQHLLMRQECLKKGGMTIEANRRKVAESSEHDNVAYEKEYLKQAERRAKKERRKQDSGKF